MKLIAAIVILCCTCLDTIIMSYFRTFLYAFILVLQTINAFRINVPQGKIAIEYYKTKLVDRTYNGPVVYYNPIFSHMEIVDINRQKDTLKPFTCVSSDDQTITFSKVDIYNQLEEKYVIPVYAKFERPFDNPRIKYDDPCIKEEAYSYLKAMCNTMKGEELRKTNYSTLDDNLVAHLSKFQETILDGKPSGIKVIKAFIEPPTLPPEVEKNRREIAIQRTAYHAEEYKQETKLKEQETKNKLEISEAQKNNNITLESEKVKAEKLVIQAEAEALALAIRSNATTNAIKNEALALGGTSQYMMKLQWESFGNQNTIYWGDSLPKFYPNIS